MKKIVALILVLAVFAAGCDILFMDPEISKIIKAGDPNACKELDESEHEGRIDKCFKEFAEAKGDGKICSQIVDMAVTDNCYAQVARKTGEGKWCADISPNSKNTDWCYEGAAEKSGNEKYCEEIAKSSMQKSCYEKVAIEHDNPILCDYVADIGSKEHKECIMKSATKSGDIQVCTVYFKNDLVAGECIMRIAEESGKATICNEIKGSEGIKMACYEKVAIKKNEPALCSRLDYSQSAKDDCLGQVGTTHANAEACRSIKSDVVRGACLAKVGGLKRDCTICEEMEKDQAIDNQDRTNCWEKCKS